MNPPRRTGPLKSRSHRSASALLSQLVLALLLLVFTTACPSGEAREMDAASDSAETPTASVAEPELPDDELPPVEVRTLERGPIESVLRFSTNLEAENAVEVYSQAARQVTALLVEEGDTVRRGEILVRLQDDEQKNELARVESQLDKAAREFERQESLFAQELISEQAMNDATYEVKQLEIAVEEARRMLSYTEVEAPIAGTVTNRYVNLGDTVTVNQHLFDIVDFDSIVARIYVPEKELPRLRLGQEVRIYSASLGGDPRIGEVERIAPIVDPKSGTIKVTVAIPANQGLLPGMYVDTELVAAVDPGALLIPKRAVIYDDDRAFVYRLRDDRTVERLEIAPRLTDREHVAPAGDALAAGDRIVVAGQAGLKNGARVRLAEGVPAAAPEGALDDPATRTATEENSTAEAR